MELDNDEKDNASMDTYDSNYSTQSEKQKYRERFQKNQDFMLGFLSGVFFNVFSLTILFFIKSKNFEEGVRVGLFFFSFLLVLVIGMYLLEEKDVSAL